MNVPTTLQPAMGGSAPCPLRTPESGCFLVSRWLLAFAVAAFLVVVPSPAPAAEDPHDNVVILLDSSGSMAERMPGTNRDKLSVAKTALKEVLQHLPESTHVGLLVFGGGGDRPDDWVYPLGPRDDGRLVQAIDGMRASGGTPLGAFIKRAADRLLEERRRQLGYGTFRLLIVSDGEAQDRDKVNRFTPEVMARGITMDVIGVAMARRHTLATQVHSYRAANDEESLRRALREVLGEVGGAAGDMAEGDAFALLEPIPNEVAAAALQSLATSGNQPIGETERPPPDDEASAPSASTPTAAAPAPSAAPTMDPNPQPPMHQPGVVLKMLVPIAGLVCFGLVFFLMIAIGRAARGRSRHRPRR